MRNDGNDKPLKDPFVLSGLRRQQRADNGSRSLGSHSLDSGEDLD